MTTGTPSPQENRGRVVPFARPGKARPRGAAKSTSEGPVEGLDKYAQGEPDNYRQRMVNNGLALGMCVILVAVGIWLANSIAEMRRNQDCVLSGRRDCAPVNVTQPR